MCSKDSGPNLKKVSKEHIMHLEKLTQNDQPLRQILVKLMTFEGKGKNPLGNVGKKNKRLTKEKKKK